MTGNLIDPGATASQSVGRRPRGVVRVNGKPISFITAEVTNKNHFTADTFRLDLEPWKQPENMGLSYWADAVDVQIEILVGTLAPGDDVGAQPGNLSSLFLGQVDDVEMDLAAGTLTITGRDLSARMIDTKTTQKWPDHTSSWIAQQIAQQNGLTPQVTETSTPVGQFYDDGYVAVTRSIPEWDLLKFLAEQEGFDCYVTGQTLYFGPPQADNDQNPIQIQVVQSGAAGIITMNGTYLRLRRSLTLAKDIGVTVLSHSVKTGKAVKAVATRAGSTSTGSSSSSSAAEKKQSYVIRRPNLTAEQAQALANSILSDITKFERTFEVELAGDQTINVRRMVQISGTQTSFDQKYYLQTVTHHVGFQGGYGVTLQGKNHSTESEPAI